MARMRRLDNSFLHSLGGGLPILRSGLSLGPDGQLQFTNLHLEAPLIALDAKGYRRRDDTPHCRQGRVDGAALNSRSSTSYRARLGSGTALMVVSRTT